MSEIDIPVTGVPYHWIVFSLLFGIWVTCLYTNQTWWRHGMKTLSASLTLCEGNPSFTCGSPLQRVSNAGFKVFLVAALTNCRKTKSSCGEWIAIVLMRHQFNDLLCSFECISQRSHPSIAIPGLALSKASFNSLGITSKDSFSIWLIWA